MKLRKQQKADEEAERVKYVIIVLNTSSCLST